MIDCLGEMSEQSIIKLIKAMIKHQNLNRNSYFVDVGSGRGIPNLLEPGVRVSIGIEYQWPLYLSGLTSLKKTNNIITHMRNLIIINIPAYGTLVSFYHLVRHTSVIFINYKSHVLQCF